MDDMHVTFLFVLQKITAWVMVSVSYRSQRVSNFHSSLSTATKNCLMPCDKILTKEGRLHSQSRFVSARMKEGEKNNYLQRQLITLHKYPNRICHELVCHLQNFMRQGGGYQHNLHKRTHNVKTSHTDSTLPLQFLFIYFPRDRYSSKKTNTTK